VFKGIDLTGDAFERLIEEFDAAATDADTVVFYYAGHGFQLNGLNHLAPVDAVLRDRSAINAETFVLNDIIARIHRRQRQTIVFLDACRNNPLPPGAREGTGEGLAQVGTGDGTFIAFATQPGNVSYDGTGKNSPFTEALLTHIGKPGRNISNLMIEVRNDVSDRTLGRQVPWDQSSLRADFYFNPTPEYLTASAPAQGGIVIGRPADSAIQGRDDAATSAPPPRPATPITIGPARVEDPAATGPADPPAPPETATAAVSPRAEPDVRAPATARAQPESVTAALSARAQPDVAAPATARTQSGTVTAAPSPRAQSDVAAPSAARAQTGTVTASPSPRAHSDTVQVAALERTQRDTIAPAATAATQPHAAAPSAILAPVERLEPAREWFPDDEPAEAAADEEQQVAALDPEPLAREPEAPPREPLIDEEELARSIQSDLARLGCYRMGIDGIWGPGSRRSLEQFYREKGEPAPSLEPSTDLLAKLQDESGTVCAAPPAPKTPQVASPPPQQKAPARARTQPQQQQRPSAAAPQAPAAAPKTPRIIGF
jgi:hypothetical protein